MCWAVGMHSSLKCNSYALQLTERVARLPKANLISDLPSARLVQEGSFSPGASHTPGIDLLARNLHLQSG